MLVKRVVLVSAIACAIGCVIVLLVASGRASVAAVREIPSSSRLGHQLVGNGDAGKRNLPAADPSGQLGPGIFPLQVSANGRYLEDASRNPWLLVGDSPQSVVGNLSVANASAYFADREAHGFNAVWINLLCDDYTGCQSSGDMWDPGTSSYDIPPFTSGTGPSSYTFGSGQCGNCNSTYFSRAHQIVSDARADGLAVILDPIETGGGSQSGCSGWSATINNNGDGTVSTTDADYRYGQYLGNEFKDLNNVVWMFGNDYQCWQITAQDNNLYSIAKGIQNTDPNALMSLEANYQVSSSLDDTTNSWSSLLSINGAYTYAATYNDVLDAYNQSPTKPDIMIEANYEGQKNPGEDGCGPGPAGDTTSRICRLQDWWTMTSGGAGQFYGGPCYGITNTTTLTSCDTTGVTELGYQTSLLDSLKWWKLVPDTGHAVVTSGYGTAQTGCTPPDFSTTCNFASDGYVTTASDYNGTAGSATESITYMPDPSGYASVTVNMADFATTVTAQWFDPTNGVYTTIGSYPNSGSQTFAPTTNNSAGDQDWVLLLTASAVFTVAVTNPGDQSGTVGSPQDLQINATDSGGVAVTYAATGLPAGLAIDAGSGLISGTPTGPGTSAVTVSVNDGFGNTASTKFTWTITTPTTTTTATTPSTTTPSTTTPSTTTPTPTTPTTATAPATAQITLPTTPLAPAIGRPKVTSVSLTGVAHRTPKLKLTVIAGSNAPALKAISIALPSGLQFSKQLKRGVSASAGFTHRLQAGKLTLSLRSPVRRLTITIAGPALTANAALVTRAHRRRLGKLRLTIATTDASDTRFPTTVKVTDQG